MEYKVYCEDCEWVDSLVFGGFGGCKNPMFAKRYDTPIRSKLFTGDPYVLNKHNNCAGFTPNWKYRFKKWKEQFLVGNK